MDVNNLRIQQQKMCNANARALFKRKMRNMRSFMSLWFIMWAFVLAYAPLITIVQNLN